MESQAKRGQRGPNAAGQLTRRQTEILAALEDCIDRTGFVPTVRELQAALGLSSTATVHNHLRQLERHGFIRRLTHHARAIEIVGRSRRVAMSAAVPGAEAVRAGVVVGRVPAGAPLLAVEEGQDSLPLPATAALRDAFALRVRGDSMIGAGIEDGDYVVVEPDVAAVDGAIVVALLGEEATVKRLRERSDGPWLVAENPAYPPIAAHEARLVGRVVGIYRSL